MRQALRAELKATRLRHTPAERMAAAEAVAERILAHLPATGGYLAGYWASAGELPLHLLQMRLPPAWIWCLPVIGPARQLAFAPWRSLLDALPQQVPRAIEYPLIADNLLDYTRRELLTLRQATAF